jgi:hypothetical protein
MPNTFCRYPRILISAPIGARNLEVEICQPICFAAIEVAVAAYVFKESTPLRLLRAMVATSGHS